VNRSSKVLKWVLPVLACVLAACICPFSKPGTGFNQQPGETEAWQASVDAIREMSPQGPIPWHLVDPDAPPILDVFDPNQLLVPLEHLSLRVGYTLDFVYLNDGLGAKPILYARKATDMPFENYQAFAEATNHCTGDDQPEECCYLNFIEADGDEAGYFQWILMRMMGDQFYLYWHAGYKDSEIIASRTRIQTLIDQIGSYDFGESLSRSQKRQALKINPAPEVVIDGDRVHVRVVWFTKWGGFYESVYTLTASAPHEVIDVKTEQLLEYDCKVQF